MVVVRIENGGKEGKSYLLIFPMKYELGSAQLQAFPGSELSTLAIMVQSVLDQLQLSTEVTLEV